MQRLKPGAFVPFKLMAFKSCAVKLASQRLGALIAACCFSINLMAMDLQQAKAQGYLGEQSNGYLGTVQPNAEADKVKAEINAKRKLTYEQLAEQNGVSVEQVARLAGSKAIQKTPSGQFVQDNNGNWVKK